jgi:GR25 family glycosyltransferase involved in LPS biosynthesis
MTMNDPYSMFGVLRAATSGMSFLLLVLITIGLIHHNKCQSMRNQVKVRLGGLSFDCYVINMPHDSVRMGTFLDSFNKSDLSKTHSIIRHDATVGRNVPLVEHVTPKALGEILRAERNGYRQKHYELTRGGVGCWLSHVGLWKRALNTNTDAILVFEDDAIISPVMRSTLENVHVPDDWDICLLGFFCTSCQRMSCLNMFSVQRFFGTHCYMIRRRSIPKILAHPRLRRVAKQIDSSLSDMIRDGDLKVYALGRRAAWQNSNHPTTIQMHLRKVPGVDVWE